MKPLMPPAQPEGAGQTLPASLWMRSRAVEQSGLSFADLGLRFAADILAAADGETV